MKTKKFTLFTIIMAAFVLFVGCKKEKTDETSNTNTTLSKDMLRFNTSEEFFNYLENAETNNEKEGFISFGKMADEAYYSINPEEMFSSMDEVIDYVMEHRELFQLILGSDGEYTVETRMYNHPFRNVANIDGLFQVGDTLYKILEGGYAYTSFENEDYLKQIVNKSYRQNTSVIKFYLFGEEPDTKAVHPHHCEEYELYNEKTVDNNRITLQISNDKFGPINTNYYKHGYKYYAKPYHKSLGWWGCNRTITANVYEVFIAYGGIYVVGEFAPTVSDSVHGGNHFSFTKHVENYEYADMYSIYSCNCTASTLDAGTVSVICH